MSTIRTRTRTVLLRVLATAAAFCAVGNAASAPVVLPTTLRDFCSTSIAGTCTALPEFVSAGAGLQTGLVKALLGPDHLPAFNMAGYNNSLSTPLNFSRWYSDAPGYNLTTKSTLTLGDANGKFTYVNYNNFPFDNQQFGNQGAAHNYGFTTHVQAVITVTGSSLASSRYFTLRASDSAWVFLGGRLIADLGGRHGPAEGTFHDDLTTLTQMGLTPGATTTLDIFLSQQGPLTSSLEIDTNMSIAAPGGTPAAPASVAPATFAQVGAGTVFSNASIGSANSYGGIAAGQLTGWNGTGWAPGGIALSQVAYGNDGTRWGVTSTGVIYRYGTSWTTVPGGLKQISVGNASNVWGVNAAGNVYKWNGTAFTTMPGTFASVSVGADGTVFGLQANDSIWRWNGSSWVAIAGGLRWISVGSASNVWGVNAAGLVYKFNPSTSGWGSPAVPTGTFVGVSTAADGSTILVRSDGALWKK